MILAVVLSLQQSSAFTLSVENGRVKLLLGCEQFLLKVSYLLVFVCVRSLNLSQFVLVERV